VEITKPDGSKETLGPFTSDPVGGGYAIYTPDQTGTYTFVAHRDEHKITGLPLAPDRTINTIQDAAFVNDTYLASTSDPAYLTVQSEPIPLWQEAPLPTEFWTRPINQLSREWYVLAGNWLGKESGAHNVNSTRLFAYGEGPESAHVMWTRPFWAGGIMDARYGDKGYQTIYYEGLKLMPPIILNGKLIYADYSTGSTVNGYLVVDLYTGETLTFRNGTTVVNVQASIIGKAGIPTFASIYDYESPNQHGGIPYLWITAGVTLPTGDTSETGKQTWEAVDGYTFNSIFKIANVSSSGTAVYGKDGSILRYSLVTEGGIQYLRVWNSSAIPTMLSGTTGSDLWQYYPDRRPVHDGNKAWSLNASISPAVQGSILAVREDQFVIGGVAGKNNGTYVQQGHLWALNLKPDANGKITPTLLWNITFTPPETVVPDTVVQNFQHAGNVMLQTTPEVAFQPDSVYPEYGVFCFVEGMTRRRWGYSLETGQKLWGPTEPEPQLAHYFHLPDVVYDGKLISYGYSGIVIAYDIKTGERLWNYTASTIGYEVLFGNTPLTLACIADGKLYFSTSEHSPTTPLFRSSYLRCVNASNGAELWKISHWGSQVEGMGSGTMEAAVIADGFLVTLNVYDAQLYCIGKGPSATTVTASPEVSVHGSSVLVKGTVADIAAGTRQQEQAARFPNGVPAMSDEDQQAWMEYLYMDQGMPTNATGVEVSLDTLDPNGNFVHIGTATSDMSGTYGYAFTPEVPGLYQITATFAGSDSYYPSYAETYVNVDEVPQASPPPEYPQPIDPTWTIIGVGIVLLIAIAIIGLLILRKK
jgi:outer membrane protein assembly factor BamB